MGPYTRGYQNVRRGANARCGGPNVRRGAVKSVRRGDLSTDAVICRQTRCSQRTTGWAIILTQISFRDVLLHILDMCALLISRIILSAIGIFVLHKEFSCVQFHVLIIPYLK